MTCELSVTPILGTPGKFERPIQQTPACSPSSFFHKKSEPVQLAGSLGLPEDLLENNLQGELSVVRLTGADAGCAVLDADGRGTLTKRRTVAKVRTIIIRLRQVRAVEDVEHLYTELRTDALLVDGYVLDQRKIHIAEAGPDDLVAAQITVGGSRRHDKAVLVEILRKGMPLH